MLLYLSTVLWSALGADPDCLVACLVDEARSATDEEVVFDVTDAVVVGVVGGLTEGEACEPGLEDAAMAFFLACWAFAANLFKEKALKGSESESSSADILVIFVFLAPFSPALGLAVADALGAILGFALVEAPSDLAALESVLFLSDFLLFFGLSDSEAEEAELLVALAVGKAFVLGLLEGTFFFLSLFFEAFCSSELLLEEAELFELLFFDLEES